MIVYEQPDAVRWISNWLYTAAFAAEMDVQDVRSSWNKGTGLITTEIFFNDEGKSMIMSIDFSDTDATEQLVAQSVQLCFENYNMEAEG